MTLREYIKFNEEGTTPLHDAAMHGELEEVIADLKVSGERLSLEHFLLKDEQGYTPLHWAAQYGGLESVSGEINPYGEKLRIEHFLIESRWGRTPLNRAAESGNLDQVMQILEESGEKLCAKHFLHQAQTGGSPLLFAAWNSHLDQIFIPSYWKGRVGEMVTLWQNVPTANLGALDFQKRIGEAIQMSIQSVSKMDEDAFGQATRAAGSFPLPERFSGKEKV